MWLGGPETVPLIKKTKQLKIIEYFKRSDE